MDLSRVATFLLGGTILLSFASSVAHAQEEDSSSSSSSSSVFSSETSSSANNDILGLHGSGTTNPSKCIWHIMAKLSEQIKLPTRFTYRAVGSGTGIAEFLGKEILDANGTEVTTYEAYNDFGAGDIPIDTTDRSEWISRGIEFVQLPFVLSAVSFFHNLPGVPSSGTQGLNMTACLLSQIFRANITTWDHPDILAINPGLTVSQDYPIYVGHRVKGSSSTDAITHYLYAQCPQSEDQPGGWPADLVGSAIEWHPSTNECDGSDLMAECIQGNEGSIGYMDAAHGHEALLTEIRVENGDGNFLTSVDAGVEGVRAAVDTNLVPLAADEDFSSMEFYNMPGQDTWPISLVSYIYIRKDLSFIPTPARRTLLKAFATALFDPDYIDLCDRYGLIPVTSELRELSLAGLDMLKLDASESENWIFEKDTMPGLGQGDRVISTRRQSFALYEADHIADEVEPMIEDIRMLKLELASLKSQGMQNNGASGGLGGGVVAKGMVGSTAVVYVGALMGTILLYFN